MICRIVIADPDQSHATALAAYLERLDYKTTIAASTQQLQVSFCENLPDLLLVDSCLLASERGGWFRKIRHDHPLIQTVVMATGTAMDQVMTDLDSESAGFVIKPVKSTALDHALRQARKIIVLQRRLEESQREIEDLRHTQRRYRQLFNESPCYLTVQNRDLRITASNRLFKEHFGDEIGCHCYRIYKHRDSPCLECPVAKTFQDGKAHQTEEVVTSKTGIPINILTWTAPIRDRTGEITHVMEMATDITLIRKLQDHLTSLGLMLGSMSHGVKGMLTALDGAVYQLESGMTQQNMPRVAAAVAETREMVDRIRKMVLQILYYAKSRELRYEMVALRHLSDAVMTAGRALAEKHGVTLTLFLASDTLTIQIDPHWMQAALINLVENAIDACVDASQADLKAVDLWFGPDGDQGVVIRVRDSGQGIDQETQEKMFTLFFSSKGSQGTGLGLFIAHHVITLHGGSIIVESSPGKGSCFEIRLPRYRLPTL